MSQAAPTSRRPIAIVPARGGSKRIPRKNVRRFHGVPLLQRTLGTLVQSHFFRDVVVSTDDDEIAELAIASGAIVPFRRPAELADDHTATAPVVIDAIHKLRNLESDEVGAVCVVYPAAVFTTDDDIRRAHDLMVQSGCGLVVSATTYSAPILRAWRTRLDGTAEMVWPEYRNARSQDLETAYHDAGQFYWWAPGTWRALELGLQVETRLFLLPRWRVHDIDDEEDWIAAERAYATHSSPTTGNHAPDY